MPDYLSGQWFHEFGANENICENSSNQNHNVEKFDFSINKVTFTNFEQTFF